MTDRTAELFVKRDEIYPSPPIAEAFPPTERVLRAIIARDGETTSVLFALGNLLLRAGEVEGAMVEYRKALEGEEYQAEILTNLGVALFKSGRFEESLKVLRQAVLKKVGEVLPLFFSAKAQFELGDLDGAMQTIDRIVRLDAKHAKAHLLKAQIFTLQGAESLADESFRRVFQIEPEVDGVRKELAWKGYQSGAERFDAGDIFGAMSLWREAHLTYYPEFLVEQRIISSLARIAADPQRELDLLAAKGRLKEEMLAAGEQRREYCHRFVALSLLSLGLIPDCYELLEQLDDEHQRWQKSLEEQGEHPYPHYRFALIELYRGDLKKAEAEIRYCQDRFLPKKQLSLKLSELLNLLEDLKTVERQVEEESQGLSPDWEWEKFGFINAFEREAWKRAGFEPAEATLWRDQDCLPAQAKTWRRERHLPDQATCWIQAGFLDPLIARRWARGGFSPSEAKAWEVNFSERIDQAVQCRSVGLTDPTVAARWLVVCQFPWDAAQWFDLGFTPDEAAQWIALGISEPYRAREERGRLASQKNLSEPEPQQSQEIEESE